MTAPTTTTAMTFHQPVQREVPATGSRTPTEETPEMTRRPKFEMEVADIGDGPSVFILRNGERIAVRGKPGTPDAMKWVPLVPDMEISDNFDNAGPVRH